jgi:hypothetical protein
MFFFRVFDFVVGDAVEALDGHHDGGDAGAGDFGGVVERAGGEAMRLAVVGLFSRSNSNSGLPGNSRFKQLTIFLEFVIHVKTLLGSGYLIISVRNESPSPQYRGFYCIRAETERDLAN